MLKCIIQIIPLKPQTHATNTESTLQPCHTERWCRSQKRSDQAFLLISTQTSKGRLECKWVGWCHCQIISTCTHMPSTHSAPLCYFNTGQMSEPQYQLFQMWISWESNNGKMWDSAAAQIKELFSHKIHCADISGLRNEFAKVNWILMTSVPKLSSVTNKITIVSSMHTLEKVSASEVTSRKF